MKIQNYYIPESGAHGGSGGHFGVSYLATHGFKEAIEVFTTQLKAFDTMQQEVTSATRTLLDSWEGEGRKQFEKDYKLVYRQLEDLSDIFYELRDALIDAEAQYIKTDQSLSKQFTQ